VSAPSSTTNLPSTSTSSATITTTTASASAAATNKLELLLSLDVALELIHADRESLKRVETFAAYPGHYGFRVRDTIEEVFVLLLKALGERHVEKGFAQ
jgi:recyclin-1